MDNNPSQHPPRTLVLIGFMGSGKSTIGRMLHEQLGYRLIDTDLLIEERQGMSVSDIFAQHGEPAFRDMETVLLRELIQDDPANRIISTGGGIILREENRKLLRRLGFVAWLKAPFSEILERTSRNDDRPLLQTRNPESAIKTMMSEREPLYDEAAHLKLNTGELNIGESCTGIIECASYHFAQQNQ